MTLTLDAALAQHLRRVGFLPAAFAFAMLALLVGVGLGPVAITPGEAVSILAARLGLHDTSLLDPMQVAVLETIRLPRVLMGFLAGAALAMAGAALQGVFRNPLADPGLIGVSAGAAFGAVLPKPISSARQPFKPRFSKYCNHATPRFWYSRRVPFS